jgi:hypothetical protein
MAPNADNNVIAVRFDRHSHPFYISTRRGPFSVGRFLTNGNNTWVTPQHLRQNGKQFTPSVRLAYEQIAIS